jgi:hypothetical protein
MRDELAGIAKAAPSASYVGATLAGWSINEWAAGAAFAYSVTMLGFLLWDRVVKPWRARK